MNTLLTGKVSLITGATRGIGKGIAEVFAKNGADIAFTYQSSDQKAKDLETSLNKLGIKAKAYKANAASMEDTDNVVSDVISTFGKIDALVNNAGITKDGLLMRMSNEQWQDVINVNLSSVFNFTKSTLKQFLKQRNGAIINISSIVGNVGNAGQANYAASKAGVVGFTKSIAKELGARNIRCNAIAPGFIATEMTGELDDKLLEQWVSTIPMKRAGEPEDVANAALFLASDLSTFISGQVLNVCGAMQT